MSTKENIVAIKLLQEYYKTGQDGYGEEGASIPKSFN
jgi:hypothetical protein